MAKVIEAADPHAAWATMSVQTLTRIFLYGLLVGIVSFALYLGLERFVFEPILCRENLGLTRCETKDEIAAGTAIVLGSLMGLFLLVRERVYRPILAVLGVMVAIWGIFTLVGALPVYLAAVVATLIFGLTYVLFSWLVQPTSLLVSLVAVIVMATLARIAIG